MATWALPSLSPCPTAHTFTDLEIGSASSLQALGACVAAHKRFTLGAAASAVRVGSRLVARRALAVVLVGRGDVIEKAIERVVAHQRHLALAQRLELPSRARLCLRSRGEVR